MKLKYALLYVSCALFVVSWFLPAIIYDGSTMLGGEVLAYGWLEMLGLNFAWLANVFGPVALLFASLKKFKTGLILSGTAFVLGLQSFMFQGYPMGSSEQWMAEKYLGIGFYAWELSLFFLFLYCYIQIRTKSDQHRETA